MQSEAPITAYEKYLLGIVTGINLFIGVIPAVAIWTLYADYRFCPDFVSYYTAASIARKSPELLYNYATYLDFYHSLKPAFHFNVWFGYLGSPALAVFLAPFTFLQFPAAFLLWSCINFLLCGLLAKEIVVLARALKLYELAYFLGSCVFGISVTYNIIYHGQLSLLLCLSFTYFLTSFMRKEWLKGAFWLAVALMIKPPFFIPLFLYVACCRQWRMMLCTMAFSVLFAAVTLPVVRNPYLWVEYVDAVRQAGMGSAEFYGEHGTSWVYSTMVNISGIVWDLSGKNSAAVYPLKFVYTIFSAGCFLWPWIKRRKMNLVGIVFIVATGFFTSVYSLSHDFILFLPVCVVVSALMRKCGNAKWMFLCYMLASYLGYPPIECYRLIVVILGIMAIYLAFQADKWKGSEELTSPAE